MTEYAGQSFPTLCPYLFYEDTGAAMEFLERAFGFRERLKLFVHQHRPGAFYCLLSKRRIANRQQH